MTRVKICGITRLEDAELARELGAWALGMIFVPDSPRRIPDPAAGAIATRLRRRAALAGVFVNAELDWVVAVADELGLALVQLHGDEGPAYCAEVARRTGCNVIKGIRVSSRAEVLGAERFRTDFHLFDSATRGLRGGSGRTWDWSLASARRSRIPLLLSGGLTPDNVGAGIAAVRPWGVDVASGVESAPGVKDPDALRAFFEAVHAATPAEVEARA